MSEYTRTRYEVQSKEKGGKWRSDGSYVNLNTAREIKEFKEEPNKILDSFIGRIECEYRIIKVESVCSIIE
jgi:hypothetical protein